METVAEQKPTDLAVIFRCNDVEEHPRSTDSREHTDDHTDDED